jgi:hypothetical protein
MSYKLLPIIFLFLSSYSNIMPSIGDYWVFETSGMGMKLSYIYPKGSNQFKITCLDTFTLQTNFYYFIES